MDAGRVRRCEEPKSTPEAMKQIDGAVKAASNEVRQII
jgi:hypothetical protein